MSKEIPMIIKKSFKEYLVFFWIKKYDVNKTTGIIKPTSNFESIHSPAAIAV